MTIREINNQGFSPQSTRDKKAKEPVRSSQREVDKAELSNEAKSLFEAGQSKRLGEIRERIQSGFYFNPDVTEHVVAAIMKDLAKSEG